MIRIASYLSELFYGIAGAAVFAKWLDDSLSIASICARVVIAVSFHKIDAAPDTKARAKGDDQGLENTNSRCEECHKGKKNLHFIRLYRYAFSCCFTDQSSCREDTFSPDRSIVST